MDQLFGEYKKQVDLILSQYDSLENQWKTYVDEERKERKKEIEARQIEFNLELDKQYQDDLLSLEPPHVEVDIQQLIDFLESQKDIDAIVKPPPHLLEAFWDLEVDVPVLPSDIPVALNALIEKQQAIS